MQPSILYVPISGFCRMSDIAVVFPMSLFMAEVKLDGALKDRSMFFF